MRKFVGKLAKSREIYEFVHSKSCMVVDGIDFASDLYDNKAFEMAIELWNKHPCFETIVAFFGDMEGVLRECAEYLSIVH